MRALIIGALAIAAGAAFLVLRSDPEPAAGTVPSETGHQPRRPDFELSMVPIVFACMDGFSPESSFDEYAEKYADSVPKGLAMMDRDLSAGRVPVETVLITKAQLLNAAGRPGDAYQALEDLERRIRGTPVELEWLYTVVYYKGVCALRMGENDNCILCRGESSCIMPIAKAAVHTNPSGSRLAIRHFTEYLEKFPDDYGVKWLLNAAHMTLGEHPDGVDPRHLLALESFKKSEFDIGVFRDVGHRVGVGRFNQSGGGVMDDFDNDGLLDLMVTSWAPNEPMGFFRNTGLGTFEERTEAAGLTKFRGGLYCVQADYNNDGHMDLFIPRGSWMQPQHAQRQSLLRNNGNGTFTDVAEEAGFRIPTNSNSAAWADYDNDGHVDLFICCLHRNCLLYHNLGNGKFEEVSSRPGQAKFPGSLGATWCDFDNDGFPDLFTTLQGSDSRFYRNNRNGTFTEVTKQVGIDGPEGGFSCWTFDFDNDGWQDIFATASGIPLDEVAKGLNGLPHGWHTNSRLYRNRGNGRGFEDVAVPAGLDKCYVPMGSNFGDLDNDGWLDFYLGTGSPAVSMLIPNRMFKNVGGKRFSEITSSTRTGHLQKGHSVAFGDWDRNGTQDVFVELGGAIAGDRYHNVLFQNPGQGNNWFNVKLVGKKTNRAAIGARITVVTDGPEPVAIHREVTSGSSFGGNPLEQHFGLGKATRIAKLEVHWPTSGTTQVFRNLDPNRGIVIEEFVDAPTRVRLWKPIPLPE